MFPGVIQVGGNNNQHHVDENYRSLLPLVTDQNVISPPPTTTMVEAESVDLAYGVAKAVNVQDGSLIPTAAGGAGASEREGNVNLNCTASKQIMPKVLLLIVTVIVVATVGFVIQNKTYDPCNTESNYSCCCSPFHSRLQLHSGS
jgi:hypothetical protein